MDWVAEKGGENKRESIGIRTVGGRVLNLREKMEPGLVIAEG